MLRGRKGLTVDADALEWIVERLGGDRGQSRSEIDKLLLYKEGDGSKAVSLDDALAVLGDTAAIGIDDVVAATFDGQLVALDRALDRVFAEGGNPVQLVRALQRHTDQLHLVAVTLPNGAAISKGRCSRRAACRAAAGAPALRTPFAGLASSVGWARPCRRSWRAEQECKSTGYPDEAIARRLCLALARSAQSARQRR